VKLITEPNKWLHTKTKLFDFDTLSADTISQEMIALMKQDRALGLAANQVELDAQIFVMNPQLTEDKSSLTVINPTIIAVSEDTETQAEGCLSYPDLYLDVKRPKSLVAKYFDTDAVECTIELYNIDARCFLHEYDHLQGITFTDRVSKLKLDRARKKQQKRLQNG